MHINTLRASQAISILQEIVADQATEDTTRAVALWRNCASQRLDKIIALEQRAVEGTLMVSARYKYTTQDCGRAKAFLSRLGLLEGFSKNIASTDGYSLVANANDVLDVAESAVRELAGDA